MNRQQQENRRVRMTKRLLKDALLELMQTHDLISISVTAICKTADVHRSTFYHYYTNPADLLREIEQDFLDRIPSPPQILDRQNQNALLAATVGFFDFLKDNRKTIRTLFSETNGSSFTARLVDFLLDGYVPVNVNTDELTASYKRQYITNGTVGMLRKWVSEDFPMDSSEIAELMYTLSRRISQY